jgi:hypothetical protein
MNTRKIISVVDVLLAYPHRKKSWAYLQLQSVRDCSGRLVVLLSDWETWGPMADERKT